MSISFKITTSTTCNADHPKYLVVQVWTWFVVNNVSCLFSDISAYSLRHLLVDSLHLKWSENYYSDIVYDTFQEFRYRCDRLLQCYEWRVGSNLTEELNFIDLLLTKTLLPSDSWVRRMFRTIVLEILHDVTTPPCPWITSNPLQNVVFPLSTSCDHALHPAIPSRDPELNVRSVYRLDKMETCLGCIHNWIKCRYRC